MRLMPRLSKWTRGSGWARGAAGLGALALGPWLGSLDARAVYYDPTVHPDHSRHVGRCVYALWHEYIALPLCVTASRDVALLISQHRDADWLAHVADRLGFDTVRGSSTRGGAQAIREMLAAQGGGHLAITPDGPRGPRRVMAPGAVYLASRLGMPLVLVGVGCDRPWRLASWDRFAIPRPFSRVRGVVGPPLDIPPDLDRDGLEECRQRAETLLLRLGDEAEAWATSGERHAGEQVVQFRARRAASRRSARATEASQAVEAPPPRAPADSIADQPPAPSRRAS